MLHFLCQPAAETPDEIFGPFDGTEEVVLCEGARMEDLAVLAGIFPSKGQARKAGFCGEVPWGLGLYGTKKPTKRFWAYNPRGPKVDHSFDKSAEYFTPLSEVR